MLLSSYAALKQSCSQAMPSQAMLLSSNPLIGAPQGPQGGPGAPSGPLGGQDLATFGLRAAGDHLGPIWTKKLDGLVLGCVWSKKLDQVAEPGLLACLLAGWPPE